MDDVVLAMLENIAWTDVDVQKLCEGFASRCRGHK